MRNAAFDLSLSSFCHLLHETFIALNNNSQIRILRAEDLMTFGCQNSNNVFPLILFLLPFSFSTKITMEIKGLSANVGFKL